MFSAVRNFIGISVFVLIGVGTTWIYLRGHALSQGAKPQFDHPVLAKLSGGKPRAIAYQGSSLEFPGNTMLAFEKAAAVDPDLIFWIDVRPSMDGTLIAFEGRDLSQSTDLKGWTAYTHDSEIEKADAGYKFTLDHGKTFPFRGQGLKIPTLEAVLKAFPTHSFILNFRDYKEGMDHRIIQMIDELGAGNRILITSEEDGILRDLRVQKPSWVFGTSQAQGTRLLMFSSIGLEAAIPLRGDIFVSLATDAPKRIHIDETILNEVHRRGLKAIAGPFDDFPSVSKDPAVSHVDGVLLRNPVM
jgi:glycerophosphoryl diester phosphodiesterase